MHDVMRGHQVGKRDGYNCNGKAPTKQSVPCNLSDQDLRYTNCFSSIADSASASSSNDFDGNIYHC